MLWISLYNCYTNATLACEPSWVNLINIICLLILLSVASVTENWASNLQVFVLPIKPQIQSVVSLYRDIYHGTDLPPIRADDYYLFNM
ncbi:hypothetical protein CDL12_03581 [Handroanthus impetiginosus]|uniref:Uncharacterized protein n=1 Tax=Handroanthus impetiginosus TaxID=429701 RepID=A0A2G9I1P7_9LAMI|nr:hypothetical protein CDL12_03581 [Handroanthus impetiginosus]